MKDKYDVNVSQQAVELLPPDKRDINHVTLANSLLNCVQWCRDALFGSYKKGATAPAYAAGLYHMYDQVVYNKAVYYSLIGANTDLPTTNSWIKTQDNFLGVDQRVKFNGQRIVLEYALNLHFEGVYRPTGSSAKSDIYLVNSPYVIAGFRVGATDKWSSSVGRTFSSDTIGLSYPFVQISNFEIKIKSSVYLLTNEQAIRNFVNKYIPVSLNYIVTPY